jgi:hypothetical protein
MCRLVAADAAVVVAAFAAVGVADSVADDPVVDIRVAAGL